MVLRTLGPMRAKEDLIEGQASLLWWLPLLVTLQTDGGKGVAIVLHSASTPYFNGVPVFFHKLSYLFSSLFQFHQEKFNQWTAVPSLDQCFKLHFSTPSPPLQQQTGWDVQVCRTDHGFNFHSVLPSIDHQLCSPLLYWRSFSVPADFPIIRVLFCFLLSEGAFFIFSLLLVPFLIPLFFFSFFHPIWLQGDFFFFCPFCCLKSSDSFQEEICENCFICSCILEVLMRRGEFHILLFCHLDCDLCQCSVYAFL